MSKGINILSTQARCSIPASVIIAMLFGTLFLGLLDNQVLSPILLEVAQSLRSDVTRVANTVTAYALAAGLAGLCIMPHADRRGRARFLKWSVVLFSAASLSAAAATHWLVFYGARLLAGLAGGILSAGVISYAADLFPYAQRGRVMGIISMSYFAPQILGVPLATQVVRLFGWRAVYLLFALLAAALWALMRRYLPELIQPPAAERPSVFKSYKGMLSDRSRQMGIYASFFLSAGTGGFVTYLGPWLRTQFQLSVQAVAVPYLIIGVAALVGALAAGVLADRFGKKKVILVSSVVAIGLLGGIVRLTYGPALLLVLGLTGLAASFRFGPMQALLTELVVAHQRSTYIGLRNTTSQLGIAVSALIAGPCYKSAFGFTGIVGFSAAMILLSIITICLIAEPEGRPQQPAESALGAQPTDAFDV